MLTKSQVLLARQLSSRPPLPPCTRSLLIDPHELIPFPGEQAVFSCGHHASVAQTTGIHNTGYFILVVDSVRLAELSLEQHAVRPVRPAALLPVGKQRVVAVTG